MPTRRLLPVMLVCSFVAACAGKPATSVAPRRTAAASTAPALTGGTPQTHVPADVSVAQLGQTTTLTGKVKLVSDNGAGIIANNSGAIISNNTGALVSDNGAGMVANNGGNLTAKVKDRLLGVDSRREVGLADAVITVHDATGAPLVDEHGKPITATSDRAGNYRLTAVLPAQALVLEIKLYNGGELSALVGQDDAHSREIAIDTASSLGAAYVLGRYVDGSQAKFNRLPASAAARLQDALLPAPALLPATPKYTSDELIGLTEGLRKQLPGADAALTDIKAILLGQASLGNGLAATSVPLDRPDQLGLDAKGNLYVLELTLGRIRKITPEGKLTTLADGVSGTVKQNFTLAVAMRVAPDGTIYVANANQIHRIKPDGTVDVVAGTGAQGHPPDGKRASDYPISPRHMSLAPDGTLYVNEVVSAVNGDLSSASPIHVVAIAPDGTAHDVPVNAGAGITDVADIFAEADGSLSLLVTSDPRDNETNWNWIRRTPDGTVSTVLGPITEAASSRIAGVAGKTRYVCHVSAGTVEAIAPDGTVQTVVGGDLATTPGVQGTGFAILAPDGTLYLSDPNSSTVDALGPDGKWRVVAGIAGKVVPAEDGTIALNVPGGLAYDAKGRLLVALEASNTVDAYDGTNLLPLVGGHTGFDGDGGPASAAKLRTPTGLVADGDRLYFLDETNQRLRAVDPDGTIHTLVGPAADGTKTPPTALTKDHPVDALAWSINIGQGLAKGPDGRLYWTDFAQHQIQRLSADRKQVELVAGGGTPGLAGAGKGDGGPAVDASLAFPLGLCFDAHGDLLVADTGNCAIRKITGLSTATPQIQRVAGLPVSSLLQGDLDPDRNEEGVDALSAMLVLPSGLAAAPDGSIYVSEFGTSNLSHLVPVFGNTFSVLGNLKPTQAHIRKITPGGKIYTLAGPGGLFWTDPTAPDALALPAFETLDPHGQLVISDMGANQIRFIPAGAL